MAQLDLIEPLAWDTEFFGIAIGQAKVSMLNLDSAEKLLQEARRSKLDCIYFEAEADDPLTVTLAEQSGFHLVDVRVVLEHHFDDRPAPVPRFPVPDQLIIDPAQITELPRLQEISAQIGRMSRFDFDNNFASGESERLYRTWIEKACQGFADEVLVARWQPGGEAVGLITCKVRNNACSIQLAGVHHQHRKQNVGTGLVQAALDWAKTQGASKMQVTTQARNVPAQRLYQQLGFFTKDMTLYYHLWIKHYKK